MDDKVCTHCGYHKLLTEFYKRDTGRPTSWCKTCVRRAAEEQRKRKYAAGRKNYNPSVDVWSHRRRRYGLTREAYNAMLEEQGGRCAVCRGEPDGNGRGGLVVDHDHITKEVRGLLCNKCNWAIGHMKDNPDYLMNAITYLEHGFTGDRHS